MYNGSMYNHTIQILDTKKSIIQIVVSELLLMTSSKHGMSKQWASLSLWVHSCATDIVS